MCNISERASWGIAWYLNGELIPEIEVFRGQEYTFIVEGGNDPSNSAKYHPFYITSDPIGGYAKKSASEKALETIYAGVDASGQAKAGEWINESQLFYHVDTFNNNQYFPDKILIYFNILKIPVHNQ